MSRPRHYLKINGEIRVCILEPRDAVLGGHIGAVERAQTDLRVRDHMARIRERVCDMVVESGRYVVTD